MARSFALRRNARLLGKAHGKDGRIIPTEFNGNTLTELARHKHYGLHRGQRHRDGNLSALRWPQRVSRDTESKRVSIRMRPWIDSVQDVPQVFIGCESDESDSNTKVIWPLPTACRHSRERFKCNLLMEYHNRGLFLTLLYSPC